MLSMQLYKHIIVCDLSSSKSTFVLNDILFIFHFAMSIFSCSWPYAFYVYFYIYSVFWFIHI